MARHRKQSANHQKHVGGLAVLAFLGLSVAQAPLAAAESGASDGASSSSGSATGGSTAGGTDSTGSAATGGTTDTTSDSTDSGTSGSGTSGGTSGGSTKESDADSDAKAAAAAAAAAKDAEAKAAKEAAEQDVEDAKKDAETTKQDADTTTAASTTGTGTGTGTEDADVDEAGTTASTAGAATGASETTGSTVVTEVPAAETITAETPTTTDETTAGGGSGEQAVAQKLVAHSALVTEAEVKPTEEAVETASTEEAVAPDVATETVPVSARSALVASTAADDILPDYPTVDGLTDTEVAGIALIALAAATVAAAAANPLLAIPLALMVVAAWNRFSAVAYNTPPEVTYTQSEPLPGLGTVTGKVTGVDAQNDPVLYTVTKQGEYGLVAVDPTTGIYSYTPYTLGVVGVQDSFEITADDTLGVRNHPLGTHYTAVTIAVTIPGLASSAPEFTQGPSVTNINPATGVVTGKFTAKDPDGGPVTVGAVAGAGVLVVSDTVDADGAYTFTYTPLDKHASIALGQLTGVSDALTFTVTDEDLLTAVKTINVNLASVQNAVPTATYVQDSTDSTLGTVTGHLVVSDADDFIFGYTPVLPFTTAKGGLVTVLQNGTYTYLADPGARATASASTATAADKQDTFTITVSDLHGGSVDVVVTVPILKINLKPSAPVASNLGALVGDDADGVIRGTLTSVDLDGDPLTYGLVGANARAGYTTGGGIIHVAANGAYTYIPTTTFQGTDSFQVYVDDGNGGHATSTISVTLTQLDLSATATAGATNVVNGKVVYDNAANAGLFTSYTGTAGKGTVSVDGNGNYVYTRTALGHAGGAADTVTIVGKDAYGLTVTLATFTVTPTVANLAPYATTTITAETFTNPGGNTNSGWQTTKGTIGVHDDDGDAANVDTGTFNSVIVWTDKGTATVNKDGTFTYTTNPGVTHAAAATAGSDYDSFTVTLVDALGKTATHTVTIEIKPQNSALTGADVAEGKFGRNSEIDPTAFWVMSFGDTDLTDGWTIASTTATKGTVTKNGLGYITYTSTSPSTGTIKTYATETFSVTITDGHGSYKTITDFVF